MYTFYILGIFCKHFVLCLFCNKIPYLAALNDGIDDDLGTNVTIVN